MYPNLEENHLKPLSQRDEVPASK